MNQMTCDWWHRWHLAPLCLLPPCAPEPSASPLWVFNLAADTISVQLPHLLHLIKCNQCKCNNKTQSYLNIKATQDRNVINFSSTQWKNQNFMYLNLCIHTHTYIQLISRDGLLLHKHYCIKTWQYFKLSLKIQKWNTGCGSRCRFHWLNEYITFYGF